jgi:CO dehydrogenase/acetyl-CoA synthase beta subunit
MKYIIHFERRCYLATCIKYPEHPNTWYRFLLEDGSDRVVHLRSSSIVKTISSDIQDVKFTEDDSKKIHILIETLERFQS